MRLLDALLPTRDTSFAPPEWMTAYTFGGNTYTLPIQTTMPGQKTEGIANNFQGYVGAGLMGNGVVYGLESTRLRVFTEARFQFQKINGGRPGDLFGTNGLSPLEAPWPGGTTGDLLAMMLLHADFGGNSYSVIIDGQVVCLRPDWVDILLGERHFGGGVVGLEKLGYRYYQGGFNSGADPVSFLAEEVAHFAPMPDPTANFRGMSWLTPVVREIMADTAFTGFKLKFTENAATPNLAVSLKDITDPDQFGAFVDKMDEAHKGWENAYKTLYLGAGADVTVIGANLQQLDFKAVQGAGETRLAQAAGVPPVVAGLSEGMQGSSLNAGNFGQARRQFADTTLSHLWRNVAGSLERIVPAPPGSRLWYDARDIPFLREDQKDAATIQSTRSTSIRQLIDAGFEPSSVVAAINGEDLTLLKHSGLFSIQLQEAGSPKLPESPAVTGTADDPGTQPTGAAAAVAPTPAPAP